MVEKELKEKNFSLITIHIISDDIFLIKIRIGVKSA